MGTTVKKAIFITGAGAGIGAETAKRFAAKGWLVGLFDRDENAVKALATELGENTRAGKLDVVNISDWQTALKDFWAWTGRLDVLLNNAGILYSGAYENTPIADHVKTINVNVVGVMNGCHAALPYLQETKGARVINMSSASAIYGQPSLASYSTSKFAVRGLTEALDIEWQKYGIRVMDIMPLFVQTAMVKDMNAQSVKRMGVKLTASDVTDVIENAATARPMLAATHWPVGFMTTVLHRTAGFMPNRAVRFLNSLFAT